MGVQKIRAQHWVELILTHWPISQLEVTERSYIVFYVLWRCQFLLTWNFSFGDISLPYLVFPRFGSWVIKTKKNKTKLFYNLLFLGHVDFLFEICIGYLMLLNISHSFQGGIRAMGLCRLFTWFLDYLWIFLLTVFTNVWRHNIYIFLYITLFTIIQMFNMLFILELVPQNYYFTDDAVFCELVIRRKMKFLMMKH